MAAQWIRKRLTRFGCSHQFNSVNKFTPLQYLANEENSEILYGMFSRLLDRKIEELRQIQETRKSSSDNDIKVRANARE